MTDVEMNLSHKDNEIQMLLAKFDSDKDSNGPMDTPETDPLALDDEEKMELDRVSQDGATETKDCLSNGTKQSDKVIEAVEVISDDTNPVKSTKGKDDSVEPAENLATATQNEESETGGKKLDKKESVTIPNFPSKENACPVINPTVPIIIPINPVEIKIEKETTDKTKPCLDIQKSGEIGVKEFLSRECDAKEPIKEKQSENTPIAVSPIAVLPKAKQDLADLPEDVVVQPHTESLNRQDNCTSGDSDMDDALHIAEDTEKKDNGFCKRRNAETDPIKNDQCPSKKLCQELQDTFEKHNTMLSDYMSSTSNNSVEEIDRHTETLISEIETLRELAQTKETEWNNILHLKKVKEEILLRLIRKKKIILLDKVNQDIADNNKKNSTHKKYLSANRNTVQDRYDEIAALGMGKSYSGTTNVMPTITSNTSMMLPTTSLPYCPVSMPNYGIDKNNINYYGNKKIVPKPVVMMPGPRLPPYQMPERNGLLDSYGMPMGRQGPIKDVQSIIADYRQRHPEVVPRRGRRMKTLLNAQSPQMAVGPRPIAPHPSDHSMDLGLLLGRMEGNPHMSVSEALASQQSAMLGQSVPTSLPNGMSFKDVLVQFANLTNQPPSVGGMGPSLPPPPPYPEVTLHPVGNNPAGSKASQSQQNNSLLHGILTKSQNRQDNRFSTFSPTLARLLTAPEKVVAPNTQPTSTSYSPQKNCMEITITPVPVGNQSTSRNEPEVVQLDDFEEAELDEDTADRPLVIDEGGRNEGPGPGGEGALELSESEVPECQGCHRKEAQFVCAGCANQWYCSRECQVSAWDDHSEVCSG